MEQEDQKLESGIQAAEQEVPFQKKSRKKKIFMLLGSVLVVLVGAALFYFLYLEHPSRQALATVNGEKITVAQFNEEVAKVENPLRDMVREEPEKFVQELVMRTLLLQEAKKEGISVPARTYKDTAKDALPPDLALIAEFMKKKFSTPPEVTQDEIKAFYDLFKAQMGGKSLKEVAPALEQLLRQGKQQEMVERYMKDLHQAAKVEINEKRLKKIAIAPPDSNTEDEFKKALGGGKPVLVDFGANSCVPCREMRPVLNELGKEYTGKASILVIDVYKYQNLAKDYQIQLLPTLIFFDAKGKEVSRHVGALDKEKIVSKLKEIGVGT